MKQREKVLMVQSILNRGQIARSMRVTPKAFRQLMLWCLHGSTNGVSNAVDTVDSEAE